MYGVACIDRIRGSVDRRYASPDAAGAGPPQGVQAPGGPAQPGRGPARVSPSARKHLLVIGLTLGYHHGSTSDGMAMFWNLGKESGIYDTEIRTDVKWITNKVPGEGETFNAPVIVEDQTF